MKKIIFKGCGTALVTPFSKDEVDFEEFGKLIEDQIKNKVDALIVCGTTGETATMSDSEKKEVIKFAVEKVNKRIPVVIGTGSNCTKNVIEMTMYAEKMGADGALIVTPYYNKATQKGLIEHYKTIANSTKLPIILYNVPSRTGVNIEPKTCFELSKVENIVAVKEASGNISQIAEIANLCGENLNIYSGDDDQIVPILSLGGIGVISVLSNVMPEFTHDMIYKFFDGNIKESLKMQLETLHFIKALFSEVNPIPVKEALGLMGYKSTELRLPLIKMSEDKKEILEDEMKKLGLI